MNTFKLSLANLLLFLALIIYCYYSYLSFNFLIFDKSNTSIYLSLFMTSIFGILVFALIKLKKINSNFKIAIIVERFFILIFIGYALVTFVLFSHYFTVEKNKSEIQTRALKNVNEAISLFDTYEEYAKNREYIYEGNLHRIGNSALINFGIFEEYGFVANRPINEQIKNKTFILHNKLFPSNYKKMRSADSTWLAEAKNIIETWKPINIVGTLIKINENVEIWNSELKAFSTFRAMGESTDDFDFAWNFDDTKSIFQDSKNLPTPLSYIIASLLYIAFLIPYFSTVRNTKSNYSFFSFFNTQKQHKDSGIDIEI